MRGKNRRKSRDQKASVPRLRPVEEGHVPSPTAVAAEALRTGVIPLQSARHAEQIPHETETIQVGDPDDGTLANEYVGDETPGGSSSTPDQSSVDEIGRAYGLQEEDSGCLRSGAEVLARRDRHRNELQPPKKTEA